MKAHSFRIVSLGFLVVLVIMIIPPASAVGIGIGPSDVQINNVLRGTSVERSLTLFNLGDSDSLVNLTTDGTAASWVTLYDPDAKDTPITAVTMKPRQNLPLIMRFTIPSDTANGVYNASIHAKITPPQTAKIDVGVSAIMEAVSAITINVTGTQNVAGNVEYIIVDNSEVNFPLPIHVLYRNTGNVAVSPQIDATISGKTGSIDTISYAGTSVSAGNADDIIVRWTKTAINPGNYTADVKVSVGGAQIARKSIPFTLASAGTLSRQGNLTDLVYDGNLVPDTMVKIIGTFENTGKIETRAKMIGEVYRDNALTDTFTSEELSVPVNEQTDLTYYLKVVTPGLYKVKAYVLYEGKKTDTRELAFTIGGATTLVSEKAGKTIPLLPVVTISAILFSLVLFVFRKRESS
jgi:hypothetical protein